MLINRHNILEKSKALGITQRRLAKELGISYFWFLKKRKGEIPFRKSELEKIEELLRSEK